MAVKYWVTRLGEGGKYLEYGKRGSYIAIGWSELETLDGLPTRKPVT